MMSPSSSSSSRILALTALTLPLALARCNCDEVVGGLPQAQIEVVDVAGNSHLRADPWLSVNLGDADSGQVVTQPLTIKNIGTGQLLLENVCVVNAADADVALTAPCIVGQNTAFTIDAASINGTTVRKGESTDLVVTFAPFAGGPAKLFVQITSTALDEPVVAVEVVGRGTDGRLCAEPSGIHDFGDVDVNTTATGQLTVRNCGVKPVTIESFAFAQNPDSAFAFTAQGGDPVGTTLSENQAIVLDVAFTPSQPGPYRDTRAGDIHVVTAAPPTSSGGAAEYDLILVGNGRTPPACDINVVPDVVNFNAVASGESATRQLIVQSVGQCGCTVDAISNPEPASAGFVLGPLPALPMVLKGTVGCDGDPAGADVAPTNITVDVTYTSPVRDEPIPDNATLNVTTSDEDQPVQTVQLEANGGGAPFCQFQVVPQQGPPAFGNIPTPGRYGVVEFGRTAVHVPKRLPVTLTNIGNMQCDVTNIAYDANTVAHEFSLETEAGAPAVPSASFAVQPGETRTFFAVFAPTQTIQADSPFFPTGSYSAGNTGCLFLFPNACNGIQVTTTDTRSVDFDGASIGGLFSIGFSGTPVTPDVDVIPGELDFGLVTLGCGSPEQRVTVYNNGGAALRVLEPVTDPTGNFAVTGTSNPSGTWPFDVEPGQALQINVRYTASAVGLQTANLVIPTQLENGDAGPPVLVPLRGEGTTEVATTDIFDQFSDPKVDVLWVIDDSGSMSPFQQQLAANFDQFFVASNIVNADFHIAVTTTLWAQGTAIPTCSTNADCGNDGICFAGLCTAGSGANALPDDPMAGYYTTCNGQSTHFITPATADPESDFECNVQVSDPANVNPDRPASDSAEGGLRAALKFLSPPNIDDPAINGGFMRDDAKLHVIFVEDEPEQSKGDIAQYIDFFKNVKGFRNEGLVAVSAIAAPPEGCTYTDPAGAQVQLQDDRYQPVVEEMNGRFQSICNPDWTSMMSQLGLDSLGLRIEFFLSRAATPETIDVCVRATGPGDACVAVAETSDGAANGYFYDPATNSVVFNPGSVPPRGSRIEVDYNAFCY